MDKEEFRIKLEEINHLVEKKDYKGAMEVVDSIEWRRVKNVRTLCVVGEIYAANNRYEDSREIFLLAYHRASVGKNILKRLVEISLKLHDVDEANDYYDEFRSIAPNDSTLLILRYKILQEKNAPVEEQIAVLEEYKQKEFTEKWSFELAKLYYRAGKKDKCEELCNEMILWFSEGTYVLKALDLKMRMGVLTAEEKEKYEKQFIPKLYTKEEIAELKKTTVEKETSSQEESDEEKSDMDEITDGEVAAEVSGTEDKEPSEEEKEITEEEAVPEDKKGTKVSVEEEDFESVFSDEAADEGENESIFIENISVKNERDLDGAETLQEKISKGFRELFSGKKKNASVTADEAEEKSSDALDFEDVPALEKAEETSVFPEEDEPTAEIKERKIPEFSLKNVFHRGKSSSKKKEILEEEISDDIIEEQEPAEEEEEESVFTGEKVDDFNLEATILAAATAQGIEIPQYAKKEAEEEVPDLEEPGIDSFGTSELIFSPEEKAFLDSIVPEKKRNVKEEKEEPAGEKTSAEEENVLLPEEESSAEQEEGFDETDSFDEESLPQESVEIVPRERMLREEEKKLFSYFVKVPGMQEQLLDVLCDVQEGAADNTSKRGNIIVMGGSESGKTRLISGLIPAICKELNLPASKVAYVFADQINGKNIENIAGKLAGGFLVIEKANQLDAATSARLNKAMEKDTNGLIVILEDDKIGMRKFMARYPKLSKKFTSIVNIPVFTNDELAAFAKVYALENGFRIDNMGMLALYNLIGINQKADKLMNIGEVKKLVDAAISRSRGGLKVFKKNSSRKKMDKDGYVLLHEKDFNVK